eukprot:13330984-Alexandrium_andersonii.AAC.1
MSSELRCNCGLRIAERGLRVADWGLQAADWRVADCSEAIRSTSNNRSPIYSDSGALSAFSSVWGACDMDSIRHGRRDSRAAQLLRL